MKKLLALLTAVLMLTLCVTASAAHPMMLAKYILDSDEDATFQYDMGSMVEDQDSENVLIVFMTDESLAYISGMEDGTYHAYVYEYPDGMACMTAGISFFMVYEEIAAELPAEQTLTVAVISGENTVAASSVEEAQALVESIESYIADAQ